MIDELINSLFSGDEKDQQDAIYHIGYIFELSRGFDDGAAPESVRSLNVTPEVIRILTRSLKKFSRTSGSSKNRSSAFNALRKLSDLDMKDFFIESLRSEVPDNPQAVYQIMIALNELGVDCFRGRTSLSIFDEDENVADAKIFLSDQK